MTSVGDYLKKEREARNLDLQEVAELTKISARYLSCIEKDDYDQLPPGPYAKGYIAAYARQVCGDEAQALALYSESCAARRLNNGGTNAVPAAPLSSAKGANGTDGAVAKQETKATRRIDAFRPTMSADGFKFVQTLRNLLPKGGNLRHLSVTGTAKAGAFGDKLRWVSGMLTRAAARLGKLPKAVVLKGLVVSSVSLLGVLILVLAGFGAYHLFVFRGTTPAAPMAEYSKAALSEPGAAAPAKSTVASPLATQPASDQPSDPDNAVAPQTQPDGGSDGEVNLAAASTAPETVAKKKATSAVASPATTEIEAVPQKKAAPELKPKPATPSVAVQMPAEVEQTALANETAPAGTKMPLILYKASICTAIEDRMPADVGERFAWTTPRIFVWTLLNASDPPVKVHHRYFFEDELVSDVTLKVGSSYWRTWSFHTLSGQLHIGAWHVDITTDDGRVLRRLHFAIE